MLRVARLAWWTLAFNVAVILWGAFVRASGSGAGCGAHWPLCNGQVLPSAASSSTLVEYAHRVSSGVALMLAALVCVRAYRTPSVSIQTRRAAAATMFFMLTEAAVGAGLVLFELVADNASMARALFMAVHLINTFLLLACLTLTAYFASGGGSVALRAQPWLATALAGAFGGVLLAGVSGAVAALGDTLYPAGSLAEAFAQDLSPTSHVLIRLRLLHPALAILSGVALIGVVRIVSKQLPGRLPSAHLHALEGLVVAQWVGGFINVVLLAPIWMQMVHLLVADAVWIVAVLAAARLLRAESAPEWVPHFDGAARRVSL